MALAAPKFNRLKQRLWRATNSWAVKSPRKILSILATEDSAADLRGEWRFVDSKRQACLTTNKHTYVYVYWYALKCDCLSCS